MQWLDNYGDTQFNGYAVKEWLTSNMDISIYIAALYLAFVFKGPDLVQFLFRGKQNVALIKRMWMLWNVGLSVFSLYGTIRITPVMIDNVKKYGMRDALCTFREEQVYTSKVGFAMGMFAISKLPEFGDTFFLILSGKRSLPFLQWFHHVTIFLYSWMAYQEASSIFIVIACMNYPVHAVMYLYFALAEAGYKNLVKPFAMYITLMQIAQMVGGLYMTGYAISSKYEDYAKGLAEGAPGSCAGPTMAVCRGQLLVYAFNFVLFTRMFLEGYVFKPARRPEAALKPNAAKTA